MVDGAAVLQTRALTTPELAACGVWADFRHVFGTRAQTVFPGFLSGGSAVALTQIDGAERGQSPGLCS